ncbi:hypothetical protein B0H15DRAFT_765057, partial [Mycena belliarum]
AETFLQHGQPYPGDDHVQDEDRFLVYQISDTEHIIVDNMTDLDVPIPTAFLRDDTLDLIAWYSEQRRRALDLP